MRQTLIAGTYTRNEEGGLDVLITLPESIADFYRVDTEWEFTMDDPGDSAILRKQVLEAMEEQATGELDEFCCDLFIEYLWDDSNWDGEIEEALVLEGRAAAEYMLRCGLIH